MKKHTAILSQLLVIGIIIFNGFTADTSLAQNLFFNQRDVIEEIRPFDFSDKFYETNGVNPSMIVNRRSGADKLSIIDFTSDERFREVRILGTRPAYDPEGNIIYWNHYGDLHAESFMQNTDGESAINAANYYPVYTFPSVNAKNSDRQAALVTFDENYFEKNILGAAVFIEIEFTELAQTKEGQTILDAIAEENGVSLDGTPIIKRMKELNFLIRRGLVKQILRGSEDATVTPFAIAKVLRNTERGAISPDSFLMYVKQPNSNEPLPAEQILISNFECLKDKSVCGGK